MLNFGRTIAVGLLVALSGTPCAGTLWIHDDQANTSIDCGNVLSLEYVYNLLTIVTDGDCIDADNGGGSNSTPVLPDNIYAGVVPVGGTLTIDMMEQSITVTMPIGPVNTASPAPSFSGAWLETTDTTITYHAPASISQSGEDTFGYSLTDYSGNTNSATITVYVVQ